MTETRERLAFRNWLLDQLREREWTQADLARRAGVSRGIVNKWLKPPDDPDYRRPTLESAQALANALGIGLSTVLERAGYAADHPPLTPLQQDVIAVVSMLPDPLLIVIYPQLRALMDRAVQDQVQRRLREVQTAAGGDGG